MLHAISEARTAEQNGLDAPGLAAQSLGARFAQICERFPEHMAVTLGPDSLTYTDLNRRVQQIAAPLAAKLTVPNALVAILLDRSFDLVAAMLGVIQAGGAYLPLDPSYPAARLEETLSDAAPAAILTTRTLAARLQQSNLPLLYVEDLLAAPRAPTTAPKPVAPDSLAYVIYTSGSTGKPKGVMVSQRNVLRLFDQTEPWFHFDQHDVWTMFHSFAFDFSVWEMWGPLLTGGRLVLVPYAVSRSPEDFHALLAAERVTILNQTPSAFSLLMHAEASGPQRPLTLRTVIFGGEALNLRALAPWFARHGDTTPELINMYGITETTVHVTYRRILAADALRETDSLIGQPIPDLRIDLLDHQLRPVPDGETGEIFVAGPGVALGYLNCPELTAERFLTDPAGSAGARMYRSGDLAHRRPDGELVYLGRADRQLKINGFRIELGEIEAALATFPGLAHCCVHPHGEPGQPQRLAAYFVSAGALDTRALSDFLGSRLPAHMRPTFYTRISTLPLTPNGKVDREALPSPTQDTPRPQAVSGSLEDRIAATWCRVLGTANLGFDDNFFDVGGTSLLLIAVRTTLQRELNRKIPITHFFEHTTIRALAAVLADRPEPTSSPASFPAQDNARRQREALGRMRAARTATTPVGSRSETR